MAYQRVKGCKDISVFPHDLQTCNHENMTFAGKRMAAFASVAVLGESEVEGSVNPKERVPYVPRHRGSSANLSKSRSA